MQSLIGFGDISFSVYSRYFSARRWLSLLCLTLIASFSQADDPSPAGHSNGIADPAAHFEQVVAPLFKQHCGDCHTGDEPEANFRVDRLSSLLAGGDSGEAAVIPGKPDESYLIRLISGQIAQQRMPPDSPLGAGEIQAIIQWVSSGAITPDSYGPAREAPELTHWAFQPIAPTHSPLDIDHWIALKLDQHDLQASPQADRRTLIRRLFLVMHGLPPTAQQVQGFLNDTDPQAWPELVEQVLGSPRFGEAFATLWLDLVRFGETDGFETNRERANAWPYRDWVISALNMDKPYDQFIREQIAGDFLGEPLGTGFLVAGPHDIVKSPDQKLSQMQRMNELDDMISTTSTAFLGLTTGCARCHNHKFDPISQRDYYAMQAIFAGVRHGEAAVPSSDQQELRNELDRKIVELENQLMPYRVNSRREAVTATLNTETFATTEVRWVRMLIRSTNQAEPCIDELEIFSEGKNVALASLGAKATSSGDFKHPFHQLSHLNDGNYGNQHSWIASQANDVWVQIELPEPTKIDKIVWARDRQGHFADRLPIDYRLEGALHREQWQLLAWSADRLPYCETVHVAYDFSRVTPQQADEGRQWLQQLEAVKKQRTEMAAQKRAWVGTFSQPGNTHRLFRGEPEFPREQVSPDGPAAFTSLSLTTDTPESQRRLALANWLADVQNPLTARVIVNRIWQFHFGTGIVSTASDFGLQGELPTHPELLEALAAELIQSGWSLKHLHRQILLSKTWQQSSLPTASGLAADAGTRLLWRYPSRRLQAEAIRDSILQVSGVLNLEPAGGPGFSLFEIEQENVRHYHPRKEFGPEQWRRMIYATRVRKEKDVVFGAFDCPDGSMGVALRGRSTTPLQAFNLLNSPFMIQQASLLAERLKSHGPLTAQQIAAAWQLCFQRSPSEVETDASLKMIQQYGLDQFCRALLNTNELIFIP